MSRFFDRTEPQEQRLGRAIGVGFLVVALFAIAAAGVSAAGPAGSAPADNQGTAAGSVPLAQQFEDVPDSNTFATFINNLYLDGIIGGYACGGVNPPEPCIPPLNRPYYRPNNNVTRAQMSKFVDNGRRNISDAIGLSLSLTDTVRPALTISSTTTDSIRASSASGAETVQSVCTRANQNCWALYGLAATGDRSAVLTGGSGAVVNSNDAGEYSLNVEGGAYRGAYIKSNSTSFYSLYVDAPVSTPTAGNFAAFNTSVNIFGNLNVSGSKGGYVVDLMQNLGPEAIEPGDVVSIVGNAPAVLGQIPVVTVRKATKANDTGVAGVVDQIMYVPSAKMRADYAAQEQARRAAMEQRSGADAAVASEGAKIAVPLPEAAISDADGNVHADATATRAETNGYANVVTLGSYKAVKVDAGFGPIHAGDLLTSSPHAGYAMVVTDKMAAMGAIIGKALGDLESGTGTVPIMVTLK